MNDGDKFWAALAYSSNGALVDIATLVQMLERRGVLEGGAFVHAMNDTIARPGAEPDRLDYQFLRNLAGFLENPDASASFLH